MKTKEGGTVTKPELTVEDLCTLDVLIDMAIQSRGQIQLQLKDATLTMKDSTVDDLRMIQCKIAVMRGHPDPVENYRASRRIQTLWPTNPKDGDTVENDYGDIFVFHNGEWRPV
jgi:hypothetical protein